MAACVISLKSLLPDCAALTSVAGVRDFGYFCRVADITAVTYATDGSVSAVTIGTGKLKKFQTRKFQNSGGFDVARNATGKTNFKHLYNARVYFRSQADRLALEQLAIVEDLVVFSPNNQSQIEIYGLTIGLTAASGKGSTGIKLEDDNTALFAFEGVEPKLPILYSTVTTPTTEAADFLANLVVLDALVGA